MGNTKSVSVSSNGALADFRYSELAKATNDFSLRLGEEEVYHGKLKDGRQISVEKLDQHTFIQFKDAQEFIISRLLPHKNIVSIYGYTNHKEDTFLLVHEYMPNGTLASHLHGEVAESLPWFTRLDIVIDVANALAHLHDHGVIHRDVKPSNILLDENFCAKVRLDASVLIERVSDHDSDVVVGTLGYIDPDYLHTNKLDFHIDVYSFGVVLCEVLTCKSAYDWKRDGKSESLVDIATKKIQNQELDELLDPSLAFQSNDEKKKMITAVANLAVQCFQRSYKLRPSIKQVLEALNTIRQRSHQFRIFSHNELQDATSCFVKCLGKGAFGTVYYGKLLDGREVAVKRFHEKKDRTIQHFTKEIEVLSNLRHQHLVSLYGYSSNLSEELLLVYEYIANGTLSFNLHQHSTSKLSWLSRLNIAIETASALAYLHSSGIIHRDVKATNVLLDDNFIVKVADFGLSRFLPLSSSQGSSTYATHVTTAPQGTYGYMDPEYIASNRVSDKSDVYSFGVILFELISSKPSTFMEGPQYVILANFAMNKILNKELEELVDPSLWSDSDNKVMETITAVAELAFQCVQCPKELRPSMKQVLETLEGIKQGTWGFNQIT